MRIERPIKLLCIFGFISKLFLVSSVQSNDLQNESMKLLTKPTSSFITFSKLCGANKPLEPNQLTLEQAMKEKSLPEIYQITGTCKENLSAPKPEKKEQYIKASPIGSIPSKQQIDSYIAKYWKSIDNKLWWLQDASPQNAETPLRAISEVINGALDSYQITSNQSEFDLAIKSAESLIKIQRDIATGGFGFPAWENNQSHLGKLTKKFLHYAKSQGLLKDVVKNGWIIDDLGRGDLYFDTGLAGEALLRVYAQTRKKKFLQAAILAGDWAMSKPAVVNFNYNAFSVLLLSKLYVETKNQPYLDSAIEKALVGVYSGMILKGKNAGHWIDAHNQRIVYRQIMLRATLALLQAMPKKHPEYEVLQQLYSTAADAMFTQMLNHGIAYPDSSMLTYCENKQTNHPRPMVDWPKRIKFDLQNLALTSLYRNKPFGGPAAVLCFLKDYSLDKGYLSN